MIKKINSVFFTVFLSSFLTLGIYSKAYSYSVLTHEAVIDACWDTVIKPALLNKYKNTSPEDLKKAKAFAYGGAIVPDMGYFPFGSIFFTDLVHYVRSGDFIEALLIEATNVNELAFALGAMAHYHSDNFGHPLGTNKAVPIMFPKLKKEFGNSIHYHHHPVAHQRVEFSFDVLGIARGNYAPENYHEMIGFEISKEVLEKAFLSTYGLELRDIFMNLDLAVASFRWSVKELFPGLTKAAWASQKKDLNENKSRAEAKKFIYKMDRKVYKKHYQKPKFGSYVLSFFIKIIPKVGPLRALKFIAPTPEAEKIFLESFNETLKQYSYAVKEFTASELDLPNLDSDTGKPTHPGEYELADEAYKELLLKNHSKEFKATDRMLQKNIIDFYSDEKLIECSGKREKRKLQTGLIALKAH